MHTLLQDIDKLEDILDDIHLDLIWHWRRSNAECCDFRHIVQDDLDKLLSGEKTFADPGIIFEGKKWKN